MNDIIPRFNPIAPLGWDLRLWAIADLRLPIVDLPISVFRALSI